VAQGGTAIRALHDYFIWKDELTTFEAIGAARSDPYNVISEDERAAPIRGSEITASGFEVLRVPPIMGRTLVPSDEVPGAPDVVVISHEVWQSRLAGDPDVVGSTIRIGAVPHEVVGVMPEGFMFPVRELMWLGLSAAWPTGSRWRRPGSSCRPSASAWPASSRTPTSTCGPR
jgi:hypothetical protein